MVSHIAKEIAKDKIMLELALISGLVIIENHNPPRGDFQLLPPLPRPLV
jgi:hypothetical protein